MKEDIFQNALKGASKWELQQMEGCSAAGVKIPSWAYIEGLWWPVRLSMEQCSSEAAASYKASVVKGFPRRGKFVDFTGGFGVDFFFIAPHFSKAVYVEQNAELCRLARHNFPLLNLRNTTVVEGRMEDVFPEIIGEDASDVVCLIDPARRDAAGRKMVGLKDCTPDVTAVVPRLLEKGAGVMLKLSPMLDITAALRELPGEWGVHAVSVDGECKELLLVSGGREIHAVDIQHDKVSDFCLNDKSQLQPRTKWADRVGANLYEPSPSVLKAGLQDALPGEKLSKESHLFTSDERMENFPGRSFHVDGVSGFSKADVKKLLAGVTKANLTVRGFPMSVAQLRKKLNLREGGDVYLFAATLQDKSHVLIKCTKI